VVLAKGIYDPQPIDLPCLRHIFGEQDTTACLFGCPRDESVPEGEFVQAVKINRGQN